MQAFNQHIETPLRPAIFGGLLLVVILTGCKSVGLFDSATPQLNGRVLDAETCQPLAGVKIIRLQPGQAPDATVPAYGAQLLMRGRVEMSAADGSFCLPGRNYATFIKPSGQWSVRVTFQLGHYSTLLTNFTAPTSMVHSAGTPDVNVGDVWLQPMAGRAGDHDGE